MFIDGLWGSVCGDGWGSRSGDVVCHQLGYLRSREVRRDTWFGEGSGPVWVEGVVCDGSEGVLSECSHGAYGNNFCNHNRDIEIKCTGMFN